MSSSSSLEEQTEAESDIDLPTEQEIRIMELATAAAVSSRVNYFDAATWWTIPAPQAMNYPGGLDDHDTASLQEQGATPLVQRCMHRYRWTEPHTRHVLHAYQQLLALKAEHRDWGRTWRSTRFLPSANSSVDRMWQQHVLDTRNYRADCLLLCGGFVEYHPARDDDSLEGQIRIQSTQQALKDKYEESELDLSLWGMTKEPSSAWDDFRSHNRTSKTTTTKTSGVATQKDTHGTATTTQTALPSASHNNHAQMNSSAPAASVAAAAPVTTAAPHNNPLGTFHNPDAKKKASVATAASKAAPVVPAAPPKPPPSRKRKLPLATKKRRRIDAMHIRQTRVGVGVDAQGTEVVCPACQTKSYKKGHALWCQKSKYFEEHCREQNQQEDAEEGKEVGEEEEEEAIEEEEEEEEEETMEENNMEEDDDNDGTTTTTQTALLNNANNHAALMNSFFAAAPVAASVFAPAPGRPKSPPAMERKRPPKEKKKYRRRIDNLHIREIRMGFGVDEHGREVVCPACHNKSYKKGHAHWCQKSTYVSEHTRQFLEEAVGNPA